MKLSQEDPQIYQIIEREYQRQKNNIELIPSENFVSPAVLEALGSILTNKYAEGYIGKRYYGGTKYIDEIENLAIKRAKKLFKAEHINVQPLSGAPANLAVYTALLEPGDIVLGMDLSHGGHLTHGHPVTLPAKLYKFIRYKTKEDGTLDYEEIYQKALKYKPKIILVGYSSYSREIDYQKIKEIAEEIKAITMADISHIAGLIAANEMNNPVPLFDIITTTTHKTLRGPRGGMIMCKEKFANKIDKAVFPHLQGGPHENNIAAKAVAFKEALDPKFKKYAQQIKKNTKALEKSLVENNFKICFKTTENHLILLDLTNKNMSGAQAQNILDSVGITTNKNVIPNDNRSPLDPSGLRIGTPAITTRGFKEDDCYLVGQLIARTLNNINNSQELEKIKKEVLELTKKFPLFKY